MKQFSFDVKNFDGQARTGTITTAHGNINTPTFMPVGTTGTVKAMTPEDVAGTGAEIILGNTYHLMIRPGAERIFKLGGLHNFMNWKLPILTDSGGFQIMSLAKLRKLSKEGVIFQSHVDGTTFELTPERSVEIQHLLGADITMVLDECPEHGKKKEGIASSLQLSLDWAKRSKDTFVERPGHGIFGIVQGGIYPELREESALGLVNIGFEGYAVGGLAVGEGQKNMFMTLDYTVPLLPIQNPRYLMGVGRPEDIVGSVKRGIDMFDCVMPTRSGRTGKAFTTRGEINIRNACHADNADPIDDTCKCPACQNYSRAYLHHLFKANEILGLRLMTHHNLWYYQSLMSSIRTAINRNQFEIFSEQFYKSRQEEKVLEQQF